MSAMALTPSHEQTKVRGTLECVGCGFALPAERLDQLPPCPNCGDSQYRTASMFAQPLAERTDLTEDHAWLPEARADIARGSAARLTYRDQEIVNVIPLKEPLTRIGRSATAHLRLEDPTVSRRHAIIKVDGDKLCLIDDRSLNGVYVNGVEIGDEAMLVDGDEIVIGRFHIFVLVP